MSSVALDASALLAMIRREPGGTKVQELLVNAQEPVLISTLNWSETFDKLLRGGMPEEGVAHLLDGLAMQVVDFTQEQARMAARYRMQFPALSLADRACLALAKKYNAAAWTTDRAWAGLQNVVQVEVLR